MDFFKKLGGHMAPPVALTLALVMVSPVLAQTASRTPSTTEVDAIYPDIEALYIDLHQNPELAFTEVQTSAKLAARVKALEIGRAHV